MTLVAKGDALTLRSPKLERGSRIGLASKYYAGFHEGFVDDVFTSLAITPGQTVLDPWNGAGTTTQVASRRGVRSTGIDVNPVLVVLGKARVLSPDVAESLGVVTAQIVKAKPKVDIRTFEEGDPLRQWLTRRAVRHVRQLEAAIQHVLVTPEGTVDLRLPESLNLVSSLAASYYAVLFSVVRSYLQKQYGSSNPTWIKAGESRGPIDIEADELISRFREFEKAQHFGLSRLGAIDNYEAATVIMGDSTDTGLAENSFDFCIGSPPYCTRIDYPILTRPELAVLGIGNDGSLRQLRGKSIGTTTIQAEGLEVNPNWGDYLVSLLDQISRHNSKASRSYYWKYYLQYFDGMFRSLGELRRVIKSRGRCALVVQDSYYKELHIDLATAISDLAAFHGFVSEGQIDFPSPYRRANMNPKSYGFKKKVTHRAIESLVLFRGCRRAGTGAS